MTNGNLGPDMLGIRPSSPLALTKAKSQAIGGLDATRRMTRDFLEEFELDSDRMKKFIK